MFASNAFAAEEETWYRAPMLGVMTGYLYEPLKPYTIHEWEKGLGNKMDADRWVTDFKEAGATYLIFYDMWIDGFVFHDTKTTGYKTKRDFVREVADAVSNAPFAVSQEVGRAVPRADDQLRTHRWRLVRYLRGTTQHLEQMDRAGFSEDVRCSLRPGHGNPVVRIQRANHANGSIFRELFETSCPVLQTRRDSRSDTS